MKYIIFRNKIIATNLVAVVFENKVRFEEVSIRGYEPDSAGYCFKSSYDNKIYVQNPPPFTLKIPHKGVRDMEILRKIL